MHHFNQRSSCNGSMHVVLFDSLNHRIPFKNGIISMTERDSEYKKPRDFGRRLAGSLSRDLCGSDRYFGEVQ